MEGNTGEPPWLASAVLDWRRGNHMQNPDKNPDENPAKNPGRNPGNTAWLSVALLRIDRFREPPAGVLQAASKAPSARA